MKIQCKKCQFSEEFLEGNIKMNPLIYEWLCEKCKESFEYKFEILKRGFLETNCIKYQDDGYFPPPWNITENEEKTQGWIEFQKYMRGHPEDYLSFFLKCDCEACKSALH